MAANAPPPRKDEHKHLHVRLTDEADVYDIITLYLEMAGRSPDTFWRTVGKLENEDASTMADILNGAFEAGVFLAREHPEDVRTQWVSARECEAEGKSVPNASGHEDSRQKEKAAFSHYA